MKFTVTYDGPLPANGGPRDKWKIRKQIHPQLVELWQQNRLLSALAEHRINYTLDQYLKERPDIRRESFGIQASPVHLHFCAPIEVKGMQCLPLVRQSLNLACELDILFLRKGGPGHVITESGDIDNRLKTLFDGLRMPSADDLNGSELKDGGPPEQPLYCVLEQDALINDFLVRTDRLLTRPNAPKNEVRMIIAVSVKVTRLIDANMQLIGD
jgi:hypothetical protein